jgi:hypothetical protein
MRPICWSLKLPEGHDVVSLCAGANDVKTSNWPVPATSEVARSRSKWKLHILPADAAGKSKVSNMVMSLVLPSFEMMPLGVKRVTAPVLTSYCEVTLGRRMLLPELEPGAPGTPGHEDVSSAERALFSGRAAETLRMENAMVEVEKCIVDIVKGGYEPRR